MPRIYLDVEHIELTTEHACAIWENGFRRSFAAHLRAVCLYASPSPLISVFGVCVRVVAFTCL
jgi:hypothetical protein